MYTSYSVPDVMLSCCKYVEFNILSESLILSVGHVIHVVMNSVTEDVILESKYFR